MADLAHSTFRIGLCFLSAVTLTLGSVSESAADAGDYAYKMPAAKAGVTLDGIAAEVEKAGSPLTSVEALLGWIKKHEPTFLDSYTLVRHSESLQGASDTHPRAIVFGADARLMLTFNGDPRHAGYQNIELIQVRENKDGGLHYEFREISFTDGRGHVSQANPARCYRCHGAPLRPIWQPYEVWNGVYGKYDDSIRDFDEKYVYGGQSDAEVADVRAELAAFKKYQAIRGGHPRYRFLRVGDDSKVSPYGEHFRPTSVSLRPNLKLTSFLSQWHSRRMTGLLSKQEACFEKYGAALVHDLMGCQPTAERSALSLQAKRKLEKILPGLKSVRWNRFGKAEYSTPKQTFLPLLGIEARDWNLELNTHEWGFFDGSLGTGFEDYVAEQTYAKMRGKNPSWPELQLILYRQTERPRPKGDSGDGDEATKETAPPDYQPGYLAACSTLAEAMKAKLALEDRCDPVAQGAPPPETLRTCLSCHDGQSTLAPEFDWQAGMVAENFDEAAHLERRLRASELTRMPPTRELSEREIQQLMKYLSSKAQ